MSEVLERLRWDTPYYAENCLKIINKEAQLVPFLFNEGQLSLDAKLEEQRLASKPGRALVLKARQIGFSTSTQGKLIQRTTLHENQNAIVVAHDIGTGNKLYRMGETMYGNLPDDPAIKPPIRGHRRGRFLHFAPEGADAWKQGNTFPNSTYHVDTAGEFEAGRGGTYQLAHLSEFALWERPLQKLTALLQGVPDTPESLVIIESTANGMNLFHQLWKDAEEGKSDFIAHFWAWWQEPSYTLAFANEREREAFEKQVGRGAYGEDEPELLKLGLTLEQLHWRRRTIANKCAGNLDKFHQEYPSTAEEAFITSGRTVFDQGLVKGVLVSCNITDPRVPDEENPGPRLGILDVAEQKETVDRSGDKIEVPTKAMWVPREDALRRDLMKLWLPGDEQDPTKPAKPDSQYVIASDVSGGEMTEGAPTPAYHSIQVIDHKTHEQVAEYRSHIDPNQLAKLMLLTALHFNEAWIAVEVTGGWGLPVIRRIYFDYHYPYVYVRQSHERTSEDRTKSLGWHTTTATKPVIEALAAEMLRDGDHGIKSRDLALEMLSYIKDEKGRTGPQAGRFSDLLIAWMIAQQIAVELPRRGGGGGAPAPYTPRDPITGY